MAADACVTSGLDDNVRYGTRNKRLGHVIRPEPIRSVQLTAVRTNVQRVYMLIGRLLFYSSSVPNTSACTFAGMVIIIIIIIQRPRRGSPSPAVTTIGRVPTNKKTRTGYSFKRKKTFSDRSRPEKPVVPYSNYVILIILLLLPGLDFFFFFT